MAIRADPGSRDRVPDASSNRIACPANSQPGAAVGLPDARPSSHGEIDEPRFSGQRDQAPTQTAQQTSRTKGMAPMHPRWSGLPQRIQEIARGPIGIPPRATQRAGGPTEPGYPHQRGMNHGSDLVVYIPMSVSRHHRMKGRFSYQSTLQRNARRTRVVEATAGVCQREGTIPKPAARACPAGRGKPAITVHLGKRTGVISILPRCHRRSLPEVPTTPHYARRQCPRIV
jgi:hypothetical protein